MGPINSTHTAPASGPSLRAAGLAEPSRHASKKRFASGSEAPPKSRFYCLESPTAESARFALPNTLRVPWGNSDKRQMCASDNTYSGARCGGRSKLPCNCAHRHADPLPPGWPPPMRASMGAPIGIADPNGVQRAQNSGAFRRTNRAERVRPDITIHANSNTVNWAPGPHPTLSVCGSGDLSAPEKRAFA